MTTPATRPATTSNRGNLAVVLGAAVVTLLVDLVAAWFSGSLALLADAAHRTTDVVAISVALVAATIAARPATAERTFGHARAEVIAACVNAGILFAMGMFVGYEALTRLFATDVPDPTPMALASIIGLAGAGISFFVMRREHTGFAARGAFLDVVGDAVGSIAALVAAGLIATERLSIADPVASLAVTALVVPRAVLLLRDAVNVLMESTPPGASLPVIRSRLLAVAGVVEVHDLHVWQISAGLPVISAHVAVRRGVSHHATVVAIDACLAADFDVEHSTIQVDPISHDREDGAHD